MPGIEKSVRAQIHHPHAKRGSSQIYGIDVLRFLAAIFVAFYHLGFAIWANPESPNLGSSFSTYKIASPLLSAGWVGVELFFVISGFVIAYTANGRSAIAFANSRFLRLFPGVLVCATLSLPAVLYLGTPSIRIIQEYIHSVAFFPLRPWIATPYWTLSIEIVFYICVLIMIIFNIFKNIEYFSYAIGIASSIFWLCDFFVSPLSRFGKFLSVASVHRFGQLTLIHHGVFFSIGILFWLVSIQGPSIRKSLFISLFTVCGIIEIAAQASATAAYMHTAVSAPVAISIFIIGMVSMVASIFWSEEISHRLQRGRSIIRCLGLTSYPLYLLHEPIGEAVMGLLVKMRFSDILSLIISILSTVLLAYIVAAFIEPAIRSVSHRLLILFESKISTYIESYSAWRR